MTTAGPTSSSREVPPTVQPPLHGRTRRSFGSPREGGNAHSARSAEVLRATGPMARENTFRFSTKYMDKETDLNYYGYRYYNASSGRWINRDPVEERGGVNLVAFLS